MAGVKFPISIGSGHARKPLTPSFTSRTQPGYSPSLSDGSRKHSWLIIPNRHRIGRFYSKHYTTKGWQKLHLRAENSRASITEEITEEKLKDVSTSGDSIRQRFLDFYASRGHKVLPSSSLVPDDPTVLLTIAGMLQFKPIFLGKV